MNRSLRYRLLILLGGVLAAGALLLWQIADYESRRNAAAEVDATLRLTARTLLISQPLRGVAADNRVASRAPGPTPEFRLSTLEREVIVHSPGFPNAVTERRPAPGFSNHEVDGVTWRLLTFVDTERGLISEVALNETDRQQRQDTLDMPVERALMFTLPVSAFLGWLALTYGLRPLRTLSRELDNRDAGDLRPVATSPRGTVVEIATLVTTLNGLFKRLRGAFHAQQVFASAAGHELRTPLAGLRTQIEVARRADDAARKDQALAHIDEAAARMDALTARLLKLARLRARRLDTATGAGVELGTLARRLADRRPHVRLRIDAGDTRVAGDEELLAALLENLVDNAETHAPDSEWIDIEIGDTSTGLCLSVIDAGPGIPEADRAEVFEPFYRADGRRGPGSGLGLPLVRAIAEAHGGSAAVDRPAAGGTRVRVHLPPATSPA